MNNFIQKNCVLMISAVLLIACSPQIHNQKPKQAVQRDNTKVWSGTYRGILPCADCNRIELEIVLSADFHYQMKTEKIGSIQFPPQVVRGKFKWRLDGDGLIQLDDKGDNMVFFISQDGKLEMRANDGRAYPNYKGEICHSNKLTEK
ncbi:MAG: copper resistance protein NlpE N-terminal domain-containing protein [Neisseriaceae bacterium]|nr:copper resistance protein NlpE N-terminal domain-containing protein [Neisseriaceae bacterium]